MSPCRMQWAFWCWSLGLWDCLSSLNCWKKGDFLTLSNTFSSTISNNTTYFFPIIIFINKNNTLYRNPPKTPTLNNHRPQPLEIKDRNSSETTGNPSRDTRKSQEQHNNAPSKEMKVCRIIYLIKIRKKFRIIT